jgi:DNA polymerase-1
MDLDRADLQVVVWEAEEAELKAALRKGVDMHLLNAFALIGKDVDLVDLIEGTETCTRYKHDYKKERQLAKAFIHGTNYGGGARTMGIAAGVTTHQAEKFQSLYFGKYPGIKRWHERVEYQLMHKRYVTNILGYRRYYFEKTEGLLPEALAWIPQSTVACVINRAWVNIHENIPEVQVLLQVHDSLAGQFPTDLADYCKERMIEHSQIVLPYEDPLIIPIGIKESTISWGHCE